MNIYFACETRQVRILVGRWIAFDLTRRRSLSSSSLDGGWHVAPCGLQILATRLPATEHGW
jgi:hypothetical protein